MKYSRVSLKDLSKQELKQLTKQLGSQSDFSIAREFNLKPFEVKILRQQKNIPSVNEDCANKKLNWTDSKIKLLGTTTDVKLAQKWGSTRSVIYSKRKLLGIPPFQPETLEYKSIADYHIWTAKEVALLGTMFDTEVASIVGLAPCTVTNYRNSLGIEPFSERGPIIWTDIMLRNLGEMSDKEFSEYFEVSVTSICCKRILMQIPSFGTGQLTKPPILTPQAIAKLGTQTDASLSKKYKRARYIFRLHRHLRGIAPFKEEAKSKYNWTKSIINKMGVIGDSEIARQTGIPKVMVRQKRKKLGIKTADRQQNITWTDSMVKQLKLMEDKYLAQALKVTVETVTQKRESLGIKAHIGSKKWTASELKLLGTDTDVNIANQLSVSSSSILRQRKLLNIPSFKGSTPFKWKKSAIAMLGKFTDADIAFELGVHASTVWKKRNELNIEPCNLKGCGNWRDPKMLNKLGKIPDEQLGELIGITALAVKSKRQSMGIAPV
ncbi:hypothetical protein [Marinicellulosiphila megalodicopiae]|uniref:hypothetical protein n=1 Tax=Marinicellulosiphila megalodicopiae TaxID=2724896 RepID=UPI003BAEA8E5